MLVSVSEHIMSKSYHAVDGVGKVLNGGDRITMQLNCSFGQSSAGELEKKRFRTAPLSKNTSFSKH